MKTLSQILVIAGLATMVACGPNAEQVAAQEKEDSIRKADSITMILAVEAEAQQALEDSLAKAADSTAAVLVD